MYLCCVWESNTAVRKPSAYRCCCSQHWRLGSLSVFPFQFPQCPLCLERRLCWDQSQSALELFQTDRRSHICLRIPILLPQSVCLWPAVMLPLHNYFTASCHRCNNQHLYFGEENVTHMQRQFAHILSVECIAYHL